MIIAILFWSMILLGIVYSLRYRNHDTFKIIKRSNGVELMYNWNGEWLLDSVHPTEQSAKLKIKKYIFHRIERNTMIGV